MFTNMKELQLLLSQPYQSSFYKQLTQLCQEMHPYFKVHEKAILSYEPSNFYQNLQIVPNKEITNEEEIKILEIDTLPYSFIILNSIYNKINKIQENLILNEQLQSLSIYGIFTQKELQQLKGHIKLKNYHQNESVYQENDYDTSIYFIQDGTFEIQVLVNQKNFPEILKEAEKDVKQHYNFPYEFLKFNKYHKLFKVIQIDNSQYFGDLEIIEDSIRYTRVQCISKQGTIFYVDINELKQILVSTDWIEQISFNYQPKKIRFMNTLKKSIFLDIMKICEFKRLHKKSGSDEKEQSTQIKGEFRQRQNPFEETKYKFLFQSDSKDNKLKKDYFSNKNKYRSKSTQKYLKQIQHAYPYNYNKSEIDNVNKQYIQFIHPFEASTKIYQESQKITQELLQAKNNNQGINILEQLADPKRLGRYYNYEGASSKVANYLKELPDNIIQKMLKAPLNFKNQNLPSFFKKQKVNLLNPILLQIDEINSEIMLNKIFEQDQQIKDKNRDQSISVLEQKTTRNPSPSINEFYGSSDKRRKSFSLGFSEMIIKNNRKKNSIIPKN